MGRKLRNLESELELLNISVEHKETIKNLITFYQERSRPSLTGIIEDLTDIAGRTGLFVGAETGAGYYDETVKNAQNEITLICEAIKTLEKIKK